MNKELENDLNLLEGLIQTAMAAGFFKDFKTLDAVRLSFMRVKHYVLGTPYTVSETSDNNQHTSGK